MATLYIVQAKPNPPGKDAIRPGRATNEQLNEEWVEIEARGGTVSLVGVRLTHLASSAGCSSNGEQQAVQFSAGSLVAGQRLRIHTGTSQYWAEAGRAHFHVGRTWFLWNNQCGDRPTLRLGREPNGLVLDWAAYDANPPEVVLVRVECPSRLVPAPLRVSAGR